MPKNSWQAKGVEISIEQLEEIQKAIAQNNNEEMDDDDLEKVAGGAALELKSLVIKPMVIKPIVIRLKPW